MIIYMKNWIQKRDKERSKKIVKQRNKSTKDKTSIKEIKDEGGRVFREENEILKR